MRDNLDEARFRAWVLKELESSAALMKEDKARGFDTYRIHLGMMHGIRHVAQHLGVDRQDLRDYVQRLTQGIADDELITLLDDQDHDGGGDVG
ncbi:MAG: hypothetical protein M3285_02780 [Actinomycetota bacterium]|nr:hypothetical protein [Actinomycetota bacterium]MDQ3954456.1 hypothetical protein [Actinomycetota bacterium]